MKFLDLLQYARDYKDYNDNNYYTLREFLAYENEPIYSPTYQKYIHPRELYTNVQIMIDGELLAVESAILVP